MWILETVDYPNKPLGGKPGNDRIRILEDTNGDGTRRQVHGLRRSPQHPDEPRVRQRRRHRRAAAAHPVSQGHQRRRQGRRAQDPEHGLGTERHARRPCPTSSTGWTTTSGASSATRASTARSTASSWRSPGGLPLQARWQRLRGHDRLDQQHVGPRLQRDVRRVRLDGEQRSELLHGDSQPLLRRRRGTADARPARRRLGLSEHRRRSTPCIR